MNRLLKKIIAGRGGPKESDPATPPNTVQSVLPDSASSRSPVGESVGPLSQQPADISSGDSPPSGDQTNQVPEGTHIHLHTDIHTVKKGFSRRKFLAAVVGIGALPVEEILGGPVQVVPVGVQISPVRVRASGLDLKGLFNGQEQEPLVKVTGGKISFSGGISLTGDHQAKEIDRLEAVVDGLTVEKTGAEEKLAQTTGQLEAVEAERKLLQSHSDALQDRADELIQENARLKTRVGKLDHLSAEVADLEAQNARLKEQLQTALKENADLRVTNEDLTKKVLGLEKLADLQETLLSGVASVAPQIRKVLEAVTSATATIRTNVGEAALAISDTREFLHNPRTAVSEVTDTVLPLDEAARQAHLAIENITGFLDQNVKILGKTTTWREHFRTTIVELVRSPTIAGPTIGAALLAFMFALDALEQGSADLVKYAMTEEQRTADILSALVSAFGATVDPAMERVETDLERISGLDAEGGVLRPSQAILEEIDRNLQAIQEWEATRKKQKHR